MAYFPNYPQQFYPQYQQMVQPQMMQPQNAMPDDRIFVQGEVGAKAYIVAPGNTVTLWDSESATIFRKTVNAQGVPVMQRIKYTYDDEPEVSAYDKRLKGIEERLAALEKGVDEDA